MISLVVVPSWLAVVAVLCGVGLACGIFGLAHALGAERRRTADLLQEAASGAEELREQLAQIQVQLEEQALREETERARYVTSRAPVVLDDREYVITDLGERRTLASVPVPTLPAPVFVDILVRESMIRTASLAAGLRRALSPEVRNRIRFEMKREVKRSRKQRKLDTRQARREFEARQRAGIELS